MWCSGGTRLFVAVLECGRRRICGRTRTCCSCVQRDKWRQWQTCDGAQKEDLEERRGWFTRSQGVERRVKGKRRVNRGGEVGNWQRGKEEG